MTEGTCKLCGGYGPLCDSHIISEFIYEYLYDEKHRAESVKRGGRREKPIQKGIREPLLCKQCENTLGEIERVVAPILKRAIAKIKTAGLGQVVTESAPYRELKLFLLATLWRAGVASGSNWAGADLGHHEDQIRQMLIEGTPGPVTAFPVMAIAPPDLDKLLRVIVPVRRGELCGFRVVHFMFYGLHWYYLLAPDLGSLMASPFAATHNGLTINVSDRSEIEDIRRIGDEIFGQQAG